MVSVDQLAVNLATDVVLDSVDQALFAEGEAGLVVIKLQVVGGHGVDLVQIAVVVGVEEGGVEAGDGFVEVGGWGQPLAALGVAQMDAPARRVRRSTMGNLGIEGGLLGDCCSSGSTDWRGFGFRGG